MSSLKPLGLRAASAAGLCAFGLLGWGCVSTEIDVKSSPADVASAFRPDPPRVDVLGPGFDPDTLALPGPEPSAGGHEGHGQQAPPQPEGPKSTPNPHEGH